MSDLHTKKCTACEGGAPALTNDEAHKLLAQLNENWSIAAGKPCLSRCFKFKNYYEVMAFVNAAAWISHQEDHHPDLIVSYNQCTVNYTTHAIDALTENDFICAAKIDQHLMV